jgi:dTMP kinase
MKKNKYPGRFTPHLSQKNFFISLDGESILRRKKGAGFIGVEGLDGSGQSTQSQLLEKFLIKKGYQVILTKEPTPNSRAGKKIRKILNKKEKISPKKLQELFAEDRKEHLKKVIIPALKKGKIVISDRYFFSSFAFGTADGLDLDWLISINNQFLIPDITFILKVSPEVCIERIKKRGNSRTLFEKKEKLAKVWKIYKNLPKRFSTFARRKVSYGGSAEALCEGGKNIRVIDGEKTIKEVFSKIKALLHSKLNF